MMTKPANNLTHQEWMEQGEAKGLKAARIDDLLPLLRRAATAPGMDSVFESLDRH